MNTEVSETSSCVPGYHIYKDVWDADVKESLIRTNRTAIDMQSLLSLPLRDGIIIGNLPRKYHAPVPYS